jgi:hypothetical protein
MLDKDRRKQLEFHMALLRTVLGLIMAAAFIYKALH